MGGTKGCLTWALILNVHTYRWRSLYFFFQSLDSLKNIHSEMEKPKTKGAPQATQVIACINRKNKKKCDPPDPPDHPAQVY